MEKKTGYVTQDGMFFERCYEAANHELEISLRRLVSVQYDGDKSMAEWESVTIDFLLRNYETIYNFVVKRNEIWYEKEV